jgi:hypothetical protein
MKIEINEENKALYETLLKVCRDKLDTLESSDGQFTGGFYHEVFKTTDDYVLTFYIDKDTLIDVEIGKTH